MKNVVVKVLLSTSIRDRETGRRFLELLLEVAPDLSPEKYNYHEPINRIFDSRNLDEALTCWKDDFLWRSRKPAVSGSAWFGFRNAHDSIVLDIPMRVFNISTVRRFFGAMSEAFGVDLAYVHMGTHADMDDLDRYKQAIMPLWQGLTTDHLREGIPEMPWAMLFGPPYVELFGRERLLTAPAARVEQIGETVYVQLTNDPADVAQKRAEYLAAQSEVKTYLDRDAFRGQSSTDRCNVPKFFLAPH